MLPERTSGYRSTAEEGLDTLLWGRVGIKVAIAMHITRTLTIDGYAYYRDRACGDDKTLYEHQLVACLTHAPARVFSSDTDVHHEAPAPDANVPNGVLDLQWLTPVDRRTHRSTGGDCYARAD